MPTPPLTRRQFLTRTSRSTLGLALLGAAPSVLAACGTADEPTVGGAVPTPSPTGTGTAAGATEAARAIVGDVVDFALTSDEWAGDFGWVTLRLRRGVVDGSDVFYIRTDASDQAFARRERLVFAPKLGGIAEAGVGAIAYVVEDGGDDQPTVLSTEPGREDYTPAWHLHRVRWNVNRRVLGAASEVVAAEQAGDLTVEPTDTVVNGPVVVWSSGALPVDEERVEYLGGGQLLEPPDLEALQVTFKLHECFPGSRYIVADTSAPPMAEGMRIAAAPHLHEASPAGATGRVNVFMNGVEGPGPMGFQPSVFDSRAGDPVWSPYWDHVTYAWTDQSNPRVLRSEQEVHAARDADDLEEFIGTPDTGGKGFVVNCPVPVVAPNTFEA